MKRTETNKKLNKGAVINNGTDRDGRDSDGV